MKKITIKQSVKANRKDSESNAIPVEVRRGKRGEWGFQVFQNILKGTSEGVKVFSERRMLASQRGLPLS